MCNRKLHRVTSLVLLVHHDNSWLLEVHLTLISGVKAETRAVSAGHLQHGNQSSGLAWELPFKQYV